MENLDLEWVEELRRQLGSHIYYAPLENHRAQLEPGFREVLHKLSPQEREIIESYLLAVQKLDVQLTHLAYQAGRHHTKNAADLYPPRRK